MVKIRIFLICILVSFIFVSWGCESFRKKFIRQSKKEAPQEEMIISPFDYSKQQLPSDKAYMQYYTYWKAWHQELLSFLREDASNKKIIDCFDQTILNLGRMKDLLDNEEKINLLQGYMDNILSLQQELKEKTILIAGINRIKNESELLYRSIQRDFSFSKIKGDLKW